MDAVRFGECQDYYNATDWKCQRELSWWEGRGEGREVLSGILCFLDGNRRALTLVIHSLTILAALL